MNLGAPRFAITQDVFGIYGGNMRHNTEFYNHYRSDIEGLDPSTSPAVREFLSHAATMPSDESNIGLIVMYSIIAVFVLILILLLISKLSRLPGW